MGGVLRGGGNAKDANAAGLTLDRSRERMRRMWLLGARRGGHRADQQTSVLDLDLVTGHGVLLAARFTLAVKTVELTVVAA